MNTRSLVLIVDDLPVARNTIAALLAKEPYDLAFANDGYDGLEKAQALTPDVILLDVMMPGIDGYEVCRRLRRAPRLSEVPIVMLTALDDRDSRLAGIEAGADDFISKPFDRVELRARLRTILRLNRYRRLLAERAWNNWVVERADVGYAIVDAGDNVVYANPLARLYLAMPPAETDASPGSFWELISRQYRAEPQEAWDGWPDWEALKPDQPRYLVRPETSTSRPFWLRVSTLDQSLGVEARHLICLRDVTDEMSSYRERATFQAMMMHKVRSPLTVVRGSAELLSEACLSDPDKRETVEMLLQGVARLSAAVNDIWRYMKAAPLAAECRDVFPLADLASLLSRLAEGLGCTTINLALSDELRAGAVRLSKTAVEWVLWELLENAVKFHPQQTPVVDVAVNSANSDAITLRVQDDGVTLSPEQIANAWVPYYQGERYLTGNVAGMGLGLPLVASLVWEIGGQCRLSNREDGPGVVVELQLPLSNTPAAGDPGASSG